MPQDQPRISVIIPNYNRGDLLADTLESLIRQDYPEWEAVVVDDGSTDNSAEVAQRYNALDSRIRFYLRDREPRGAPVCRNIGIGLSTGEYLIFLDSDDLLAPGALSQRAHAIRNHPEDDFWVFPMLMFRDDPTKATMLWNIDNGKPDLSRFLVLDAPWQTSGPIWRKEPVIRIGGFTEGLACWQDVDFHLKALIAGLKGRKWYDLAPDVFYRQHETQSISQGEISSPDKLQSRCRIFVTHTLALNRELRSQYRDELRILGGNIVIGAARALQTGICHQAIRFGRKHRIFSAGMAFRMRIMEILYLLRLNRISLFRNYADRMAQKYRQDAHIGKHPYKTTR